MRILLENTPPADTSATSVFRITPLIWASGRGFTEIVRLLVEKGAKVNQEDQFGTTPLIYACRQGFNSIAEILLTHGANIDAVGK